MRAISRVAAALLALAAGGAMAQAAGDRVLGQWGDGLWYPARVQQVEDKNYHVAFDDGDVAVLRRSQLRDLDWKAGTRLQCNWQNRGRYYPGTIEDMKGETLVFRYDDGYKETITVSRCRSD